MSNSFKLSETIRNNPISSKESISQQKKVEAAVCLVVNSLQKKYPKIHFKTEKKLTKLEISIKVKKANIEFGSNISNSNSFIRPDAGFLYAYINGMPNLILSGESKKQGTNELRKIFGLEKQARGNAVERTSKNCYEISQYMMSEDIFPYIIFISGCDFVNRSSIRDRITANNYQCEFNKLHIYKKKGAKIKGQYQYVSIPSVFIRNKQWSVSEIRDRMFDAANMSLKYYFKKYKNN